MQLDAKPFDRKPEVRIEELKKLFLDFSKKMKSPDFIVPDERTYEKQFTIDDLDKSFTQFMVNADNANSSDLVEWLPLGPITNLEIIHLTFFHTQRHLHQMKNL